MIRGDRYPLDLADLRSRFTRPITWQAAEDCLAPLGGMLVQSAGSWKLCLGLLQAFVRVPRLHNQSRAASYFAVERVPPAEALWIRRQLHALEEVSELGRAEIARVGTLANLPALWTGAPEVLALAIVRWRALERHSTPAGVATGGAWLELETWAAELARARLASTARSC